MNKQSVPCSIFSAHAREPGNEARRDCEGEGMREQHWGGSMRKRVQGSNTVKDGDGEDVREQHREGASMTVLGSKMGGKTAEEGCKERV